MASFVVYLGAFLLAVSTASALKCYACDGFTCNYGLLSFTYPEVECQAKTGSSILDAVTSLVPTQCVKITGKDEHGSSFVVRNCTTLTGDVGCNALVGLFNLGSNLQDLECATCTENLCNSASKYGGLATIGLIIACLVFMF